MTVPQCISRSNARFLYWSFAQQLVHQASNGTTLEPQDLYASGTISGPESGMEGSLLELSWRGTRPLTLAETGETRTFLEDGDTVTFRAYAERGDRRIGFGELRNQVGDAA
jgi:fumarylacetoacetase